MTAPEQPTPATPLSAHRRRDLRVGAALCALSALTVLACLTFTVAVLAGVL